MLFLDALSSESMKGKPVLLVLNKQDLQTPDVGGVGLGLILIYVIR